MCKISEVVLSGKNAVKTSYKYELSWVEKENLETIYDIYYILSEFNILARIWAKLTWRI
jgi:hypothetical protein